MKETTVKKFVDELNSKMKMPLIVGNRNYGFTHDFKYRFDESEKLFIIYDSEGFFDWYTDNIFSVDNPQVFSGKFVQSMAEKMGLFCEPYSCSCDFSVIPLADA